MWPRFGIKIGNSTLCIANVKSEGAKPEVIANKQGDRVSQACLLWDGAEEIECGLTAKQKMAARPKQAVANSFQLLLPREELKKEQLEKALKEIPCAYDASTHTFQLKCSSPNDNDDIKETTRQLSAYDVHVQLLRAELELARQYHSDSEQNPIVVLSIPSYFPAAASDILAQTAEQAGFHVAQVIAEPTAAVLAYGIGENEASVGSKYVLTIKSGGLFSHFTLYEVHNGLYTQLDTYGPYAIGGRQITEALVQFICEEFQRKYKLDPNESRRSMAKIRTAAANCKHILSTLPSTQLYIDSLMDGLDFNTQMSRARFESLIQPVINNFMQMLSECVERAIKEHSEIERIDAFVLLGATMQIPKLQSAIASRYADAKLHASLSADEVVAVGCARQATFLSNPEGQDLQATEECICAEDELLIWHGDDDANAQILLHKGTLLPNTIKLEVKLNEKAENAEIFRLRVGENINEIYLKGASTKKDECGDEVFHLEAEIALKHEEDALTPVIRLRCI